MLKVKLGLFSKFTIVYFDLISNIFVSLCKKNSQNETFDMVQSYKSGWVFPVGLGLKFVKIFWACIQNFFITLRVIIFFFRDLRLLCSPR